MNDFRAGGIVGLLLGWNGAFMLAWVLNDFQPCT